MTIKDRIESFKNLDEEDILHAFARFKRTFIYSAIVLAIAHVLTVALKADDPLAVLQDPDMWKSALAILFESLLVGATMGVEKASRSIEYKR